MDNNESKAVIKKYTATKALLPLFAQDFIDSLISDGKASKTVLAYANDLLHFFKYVKTLSKFKDVDINKVPASDVLDELSVKDLDGFKFYLVGNDPDRIKSSSAFISRKLSTVRSMYKYFINTDEIKLDMASRIRNPKTTRKEISILQLNEVDSIYDALNKVPKSNKQKVAWEKTNLRDKAIITLFFGTGLRVSELVSIDLSDINYLTAEITVKRKGEEICRVNFNMDVENTINDYVNNCRPALLGETKTDALFISTSHQRLTARSVERLIKKYALIAGIGSNVTPHELRRTYGNTLYKNSGDIYLTAAALNHKSIQTTINHYVPHNTEKLKEMSKDTTLTSKR